MQVVGYYICERVAAPNFLHGFFKQIYSVSSCIGEQHPNLRGCFWQGYEKEKEEYRKRWKLDDEAFQQLCLDVSNLFERKLLDADGRFLCLADVLHIYKSYFADGSCLLLCNSLQTDVRGDEEISFNIYGLVENSYSIVEQYASSIAEMGEPVDWLPYEILLYEC